MPINIHDIHTGVVTVCTVFVCEICPAGCFRVELYIAVLFIAPGTFVIGMGGTYTCYYAVRIFGSSHYEKSAISS